MYKRQGIYPDGIKTLSIESLKWPKASTLSDKLEYQFGYIQTLLENFLKDNTKLFSNRKKYYDELTRFRIALHDNFYQKFDNIGEFEGLTGLVFNNTDFDKFNIELSPRNGFPRFYVQSISFNRRVGFNGKINNQAVISIIQQRDEKAGAIDVVFNGGVTLIFDLNSQELLYAIKKDIRDDDRLEKRKMFVLNKLSITDDNPLRISFDTNSFYGPFASLHNSKQ